MTGRCPDENEVACEKGLCSRIEHGQVAIRMRRRPSLQFESPSSEIKRQTIGDGQSRRNESHLVDEFVANNPAKRLEIEFAAHRQGSRKITVADKGRAEPIERRVAEHVIRMHMRIDDIEDRLVGAGADGGKQPLANRQAAAGVDDGHSLVADHEADIGDVAQVRFAHQGDFAGMDEHARRYCLDRQRGESFAAERALQGEGESGDEGAD
jgi:hypothetical protein